MCIDKQTDSLFLFFFFITLSQALSNIEAGEEITVAYHEIPLDLFADNLVHSMHMDMGIEVCQCEFCREARKEEEDVTLDLDLSLMWDAPTARRMEDEQLASHVTTMLRMAGEQAGAAASYALRERYGHFLTYADGKRPEDCRSYCPDLAYVLGEIYCTRTIHIPGQTIANYKWWAMVYARAINATRINVPNAMVCALLARAYASIMSCQERAPDDEEGQKTDTREFLTSWVSLRGLHTNIFGHTAYLVLAAKSYPLVGELTIRLQKEIFNTERQVTLLQLERERLEQEEIAKSATTVEREEVGVVE